MTGYYVLDGENKAIPATAKEFSEFVSDPFRKVVSRTELPGDVQISTVFLGLDHGWGRGDPVLFETMIFGGEYDQHMWRYTSRDGAVVGHLAVLDALRAGLDPNEAVSDAG